MIKLMNTEFYKLRKSVYLKLLCAGVILYRLSELLAGTPASDIDGFMALMQSFINWEIPYLFCGIFAAFYISGDIERGGIEEELLAGFSKKIIFVTKTGMFFIGCILLLFCYQFIPTVIFSVLNGFAKVKTVSMWKAILCMEGAYLTIFVSCIGSCILFAFIFRKIYSSIVAEVFYIMIVLGILVQASGKYEIVRRIYQVLPYQKFQLIIQNIIDNCSIDNGMIELLEKAQGLGRISHMSDIILNSGIVFLLALILGYGIFHKFQLR